MQWLEEAKRILGTAYERRKPDLSLKSLSLTFSDSKQEQFAAGCSQRESLRHRSVRILRQSQVV